MTAGEAAGPRLVAGHPPFDHDLAALRGQGQRRARVGAVDDDLAGGRGNSRHRQEGEDREHADQNLPAGDGKHRGHTKHVHRLIKWKLEADTGLTCKSDRKIDLSTQARRG